MNSLKNTDFSRYYEKAMTALEGRVTLIMRDYLQTSESDLYAICKNIVKIHGEDPRDSEIMQEVEFFYNSF